MGFIIIAITPGGGGTSLSHRVQLLTVCTENEVYPIAPLLARGKIVLDTRSCLPLSLASYHQPVSHDDLVRNIINCTNHIHYVNLAFPQISPIDNKPACTACNNVLFQGVIKQGFASWTPVVTPFLNHPLRVLISPKYPSICKLRVHNTY